MGGPGASPPRSGEIRSYRDVFELERRIYRIDRLRLNPAGVPLRGAAYFLALLLAALLCAALPLVGAVARLAPWYVRDLLLPGSGAAVLGAIRIDGRPFHVVARAVVGYALGPIRLRGDGGAAPARERWRPREVVLLPDGSEARLRGMRITGPALVRVRVAHERVESRRGARPRRARARETIAVRELRGRRPARCVPAIALPPGARLRVR